MIIRKELSKQVMNARYLCCDAFVRFMIEVNIDECTDVEREDLQSQHPSRGY